MLYTWIVPCHSQEQAEFTSEDVAKHNLRVLVARAPQWQVALGATDAGDEGWCVVAMPPIGVMAPNNMVAAVRRITASAADAQFRSLTDTQRLDALIELGLVRKDLLAGDYMFGDHRGATPREAIDRLLLAFSEGGDDDVPAVQ